MADRTYLHQYIGHVMHRPLRRVLSHDLMLPVTLDISIRVTSGNKRQKKRFGILHARPPRRSAQARDLAPTSDASPRSLLPFELRLYSKLGALWAV